MAVQVLGSPNVGRGHRPVDGNLDVFLLKDRSAGSVCDGGSAALPSHFVVGRNAWLREEAGALHAAGGFGLRHGVTVVSGPTIGGGGSCGIGGLGHYFSSRFLKMTGKPPPGAHAGAFKKTGGSNRPFWNSELTNLGETNDESNAVRF